MTLNDWRLQTFVYPDWTRKRWELFLTIGVVILETTKIDGTYRICPGEDRRPEMIFKAKDDEDAFQIACTHIIQVLHHYQSRISDDLKKLKDKP